jgi:hypothetical protein
MIFYGFEKSISFEVATQIMYMKSSLDFNLVKGWEVPIYYSSTLLNHLAYHHMEISIDLQTLNVFFSSQHLGLERHVETLGWDEELLKIEFINM